MKFEISRTSMYEGKPCEGAKKDKFIRVDIRSVNDPAKIPAHGGETNWWYGEYTNHRVEKNQIVRDIGEEDYWYVEIDSLEELIKFQQKYGNIIISTTYNHKKQLPTIEIYDSYRE